MRFAPSTSRRSLAAIAASALLLTGLGGLVAAPAYASTSVDSVTNPVNTGNQNSVVVSYSGVTVGDPITVTITDKAGKSVTSMPATAPAQSSSGSRNVNVTTLEDGTLTAVVSGQISGTGTRQTVKDTVPAAAPTNLTTTPATTVNAAQQKNVVVSANAGGDAASVRLRIRNASGSTVIDRTPTNNNGTYTSSFDVTTIADGTLTVEATAIDTGLNETTVSKTITKDTLAPTVTYGAYTGVTQTNKVNATTPGSGGTVGVNLTANEAATFSVQVTDSASASQTFNSTGVATTTKSVAVSPYGFADGTLTVSSIAVDVAGNASAPVASSLFKDTTVPVVAGLTVTPSPINNNGKTAVKVTGTVQQSSAISTPSEPNTTVRITPSCPLRSPSSPLDNPSVPAAQNVTMAANGSFTATFDTTDCADGSGSVTFTTVATDPNGNASQNAVRSADKDVVPPGNPVLTSLPNALPPNVSAVPYSGSAETGTTVTVTFKDSGSKSVVTTLTAANNSFSGTVDLTSLADGTFSATAVASDAAGNVSPTSDARTAVKDTTVFALVSSSPANNQRSKTVANVSATFNEPLSPASSSIVVKDASNAIVAGNTSYADGQQTIVFTPTNPFPTGSYTATVIGKESRPGDDPATNNVIGFAVDPNAPSSPSISSVTDPVNSINQTSVHVVGTGEAGTTVTVTVSGGTAVPVTKTGTISGSGSFDVPVDVSTLPDGTVTAVAKITRPAPGCTSACDSGNGNSKSATKDTVKPTASGATATDTTQAQPSTTVKATSDETGDAVTVTLTDKNNKKVSGTGTTGSAGAISVSVDASSLADGAIGVAVVVTDPAGNPSDPATATFTKDATGPTVTGLAATSVNAAANGKTTITGSTGEAGSVALTVTDPAGKAVTTSVAVASSAFSATVDVSSLADGTLTVTAVASDSKGNKGPTATATTPKDATPPTVTNLAATATGGTNNTTTVSGNTEAGASVALTITDGTKSASKTVTAAGSGAFSGTFDLTGYAGGSLPVTATPTDTAGNTGQKASTTASRDVTAPVVTNLAATPSTADEPSSTVTGRVDDRAASVSITATDKNSKSVTGTATVTGDGQFSATLDLSGLADGTVTVTATATDAVGNAGTATTTTTRDSTARSSTFTGLAPSRVLDTRSGLGAPKAQLAPKQTLTVQITGKGGVPATGVASVVLNVTVVKPTSSGYVTAYPAGGGRPVVSNLNFTAGQTVPNLVVVPVSTDGKVSFFNGQAGRTDLLADVAGYFNSGTATAPGSFGSLAPRRILDTRSGNGAPVGAVAPKATLSLKVTGSGGVPAGSVSAVIVNVTVVDPTSNGYVTVYPQGGSRPVVSNLNFVKGKTVPNLVIVPVSADGKIAFFNGQAGTTHLLADVAGYFVSGTPTLSGAFATVEPSRILDTRSSNGTAGTSPIAPRSTLTLQVAGRATVPANAGSVVLNVTAVTPGSSGFVTVYPAGDRRPVVSNLNFDTGQTVPNLTLVRLSSSGQVQLFNGSAGSTHLLADVPGYFLK